MDDIHGKEVPHSDLLKILSDASELYNRKALSSFERTDLFYFQTEGIPTLSVPSECLLVGFGRFTTHCCLK